MSLLKAAASQPKVNNYAILMLNMGGPKSQQDVYPFLKNLFLDENLVPLPFQKVLGPFIAAMRYKKVQRHYQKMNCVNSASPIYSITQQQGQMLVDTLNKNYSTLGKFTHHIGFRYVTPSISDALDEIFNKNSNSHIIAFSQYQQFSCTTAGSSFTELMRQLKQKNNSSHTISVIDRWHTNGKYIADVANTILEAYDKLSHKNVNETVVIFSGHALPLLNVVRGDQYVMQVASTAEHVMKQLNLKFPYRVCWQSQVGFVRWFGARTDSILQGICEKKLYKNVIIVPITFTSDHIETLYEIDHLLLANKLIEENGINVVRTESMNIREGFIDALADIVVNHIKSGKTVENGQFYMRCHECKKDTCGEFRAYFK